MQPNFSSLPLLQKLFSDEELKTVGQSLVLGLVNVIAEKIVQKLDDADGLQFETLLLEGKIDEAFGLAGVQQIDLPALAQEAKKELDEALIDKLVENLGARQ